MNKNVLIFSIIFSLIIGFLLGFFINSFSNQGQANTVLNQSNVSLTNANLEDTSSPSQTFYWKCFNICVDKMLDCITNGGSADDCYAQYEICENRCSQSAGYVAILFNENIN